MWLSQLIFHMHTFHWSELREKISHAKIVFLSLRHSNIYLHLFKHSVYLVSIRDLNFLLLYIYIYIYPYDHDCHLSSPSVLYVDIWPLIPYLHYYADILWHVIPHLYYADSWSLIFHMYKYWHIPSPYFTHVLCWHMTLNTYLIYIILT